MVPAAAVLALAGMQSLMFSPNSRMLLRATVVPAADVFWHRVLVPGLLFLGVVLFASEQVAWTGLSGRFLNYAISMGGMRCMHSAQKLALGCLFCGLLCILSCSVACGSGARF
jgi:hypothetical protein